MTQFLDHTLSAFLRVKTKQLRRMEEGIEGILSDVLDDEAVIKATLTQILEQWSKAKTAKENEEVVKKIDLDKMDLVEKMSQITQEKLATYTPKKQESQTEEQKRIKEAILQGYSEAPDGSETESGEDDGDGGGGLTANNNAASIQQEQAEYREKQKAAAIAKKDKDKQDRANQKNQAEERKKRAQAKAAKGERRA